MKKINNHGCEDCPHEIKTDGDWEERFDEKFPDLVDVHRGNPFSGVSKTAELKSFIRTEIERSYHQGRADEAMDCHKHCEKAREEGYKDGEKDCCVRVLKLWLALQTNKEK